MDQSITDFLSGLSKSITQGFFLLFWGIASAIDAMFVMRGLGFVLVGLLGVLTGALVYKK